jgi:DNA mismatch repair protein MutS
MMEQYWAIKTANPGCLLFYRMGDFYELFFEDAEIASRALGIALTKRGKHLGADIPMCGVPIHASNEYLQKLIAAGHKVAVCEQTEDPAEAKKRGGKSVVQRAVIRLVTSGTLTEDSLLEPGRSNFLLAVARSRGAAADGADAFGLAWIDISTGEFRVTASDRTRLAAELARIEPREMLVPDAFFAEEADAPFWRGFGSAVTPMPGSVFDGASAGSRLAGFFGVASADGFGSFSRAELSAAAAILSYVERTQIGERPALAPPVRESGEGVLLIDAATRANLEISRTTTGNRAGSLIAAIDRTVTAGGSRLLAQRLAGPSTDPEVIAGRLDAIGHFLAARPLRHAIRERLAGAPDMMRAFSRISLDRGGPRDLAAIRDGLRAGKEIAALMDGVLPPEVEAAHRALATPPERLVAALTAALDDELPLFKRDGGFVRAGFREELDQLRALRDESRRVIAGLQAGYAEEAGVKSLKIKHNNVLGYFIEVAAQHGEKMLAPPLAGRFIHRQTMAGAMRFVTTELAELEARIASAGEKALATELACFDALEDLAIEGEPAIRAAAEALAALDVATALAHLAEQEAYCRPQVDRSLAFAIAKGRHPVVEQALRPQGEPFIANDSDLGPAGHEGHGRIWLITGPNMAGKSTFLRQNAVIAILAQIGSYVPAASAHIGVVDRLFSRVGAADDLARGRSTFMVEMVETAAILNQAGPRSLVILDEIGRGTATFDGLSIAFAAIEHLHEVNRSRALFATHYHELTALSAKLGRLHNATVRVKEWKGEVVFLHEIVPGAADRSYGIQVARLAGLPPAVIERARTVLRQLEANDRKSPATLIDDLPLFAAVLREEGEAEPDRLRDALKEINPDDLTPKQALEALYRLKGLEKD